VAAYSTRCKFFVKIHPQSTPCGNTPTEPLSGLFLQHGSRRIIPIIGHPGLANPVSRDDKKLLIREMLFSL
jgi:hypothetical protein